MSFKERHCKHCLKKTFNKGEENEHTVYYHYVLEAKLVVGDIVISLDSEFVENEREDVEKQDCEIRAFYRMAKRIKKEYPKLPIIISGDALYTCDPVISTCRKNKWEYILRLKEDRLKLLGEEIKCLEKAEKQEEIKYWNNLKYQRTRGSLLSPHVFHVPSCQDAAGSRPDHGRSEAGHTRLPEAVRHPGLQRHAGSVRPYQQAGP